MPHLVARHHPFKNQATGSRADVDVEPLNTQRLFAFYLILFVFFFFAVDLMRGPLRSACCVLLKPLFHPRAALLCGRLTLSCAHCALLLREEFSSLTADFAFPFHL